MTGTAAPRPHPFDWREDGTKPDDIWALLRRDLALCSGAPTGIPAEWCGRRFAHSWVLLEPLEPLIELPIEAEQIPQSDSRRPAC